MKIQKNGNSLIEKLFTINEKYTFLVGAGVSMNPPSNLSSARQIINTLLKYSSPPNELSSLISASKDIQFEHLIDLFGNVFPKMDYLDYFESVDNYNIIHKYLAHLIKLKQYVITTNFDYLIEYALLSIIPNSTNITPIITKNDFTSYSDLELLRKENRFPIIKLHSSKKNIITGENCKDSLVSTMPALIKNKQERTVFSLENYKIRLFNSIMKSRNLVVIGYSGGDIFDIIPAIEDLHYLKSLIWIEHTPNLRTNFIINRIENNKSTNLKIDKTLLKALANKNYEIYHIQANTENIIKTYLWKLLIPEEPLPTSLPPNNEITFSGWVENNLPVISKFKKFRTAALFYLITSDFSKFLDCSNQARHIAVTQNDYTNQAEVSLDLGFYYYIKNDFEKALKQFNQAYKYFLKTKNIDLQNHVLASIAKVQSATGNIKEAKKLYEQIYKYAKEQNNILEQAAMLNNIGAMNLDEGNLNDAYYNFLQAKQLAKEVGYYPAYVSACSNLAMVYQNLNAYDLALTEYNEALKIDETISDLYGKSQILFDIGVLYNKIGDNKNAIKTLEQVIALDDQINAYNIKINHLRSLAEIYSNNNNLKSAVDICSKALELAEKLEDKKEIITCFGSYGYILEKNGKFNESILKYLKQSDVAKDIKDFSSQIIAIDSIGRVYREMKNFKKSIKYYLIAIDVALKNEEFEKRYYVLNHLGETYYKWGKYDEALCVYDEIFDIAMQSRKQSWIQQANQDYELIKNKISAIGGTPSDSRDVHTFPKNLNATQCPACGIPYSITTFAQQVKIAYPNPRYGEILFINCSECNYLALWVFHGEW
ncbi:MAG: tetratricopeptide repeat protein [Nanoarchaeota archaeon]|nr:tetratricopeptide repeat protein [Nanoarchaeota archaeon]